MWTTDFLLTPLEADRKYRIISSPPPKMGAIADVYHVPQSLYPHLRLGHRARVSLWWMSLVPQHLQHFLVATTGDIHARILWLLFHDLVLSWVPGKVHRNCSAWSSCCYCDAWYSHHWFLKALLQTLGEKSCFPGALLASFITSHPVIPTFLPTLLESLPFSLTNGTSCSELPTTHS